MNENGNYLHKKRAYAGIDPQIQRKEWTEIDVQKKMLSELRRILDNTTRMVILLQDLNRSSERQTDI